MGEKSFVFSLTEFLNYFPFFVLVTRFRCNLSQKKLNAFIHMTHVSLRSPFNKKKCPGILALDPGKNYGIAVGNLMHIPISFALSDS